MAGLHAFLRRPLRQPTIAALRGAADGRGRRAADPDRRSARLHRTRPLPEITRAPLVGRARRARGRSRCRSAGRGRRTTRRARRTPPRRGRRRRRGSPVPPDSASSVAKAFAVCSGWRYAATYTWLSRPTRSRDAREPAERGDRVVPRRAHRVGSSAGWRRDRTPPRTRSRRRRTLARRLQLGAPAVFSHSSTKTVLCAWIGSCIPNASVMR